MGRLNVAACVDRLVLDSCGSGRDRRALHADQPGKAACDDAPDARRIAPSAARATLGGHAGAARQSAALTRRTPPAKRDYRVLVLGERGVIKLVDAFQAEDDKEAWDRTEHWTTAGYKFELWCGLQQIEAGGDGLIG